MADELSRIRVSRRGLLKVTGIGLALTALSSCGATATPTAPPAPSAAPAASAAPAPSAAPAASAAAASAAASAPPAAGASAPAAVAKPFAGKELNLLGPNHHTAFVKDLWIPLFQEKTGAKVNYTEI